MERRKPSHVIESQACDLVRSLIDGDGSALFREVSGRDYGVDAIVELFDDGEITGKIAFLQIKGSAKKLVPLKKQPSELSCTISASNAEYARQNNIPVILISASLEEQSNFYYVKLQDVVSEKQHLRIRNGQAHINVHIPIDNCILEKPSGFREVIESYY